MEKRKPDFSVTESKECTSCKGTGIYVSKGFTAQDGTVYPTTERTCSSCDGSKTWPAPNYSNILDMLVSKKGKNKGSLRASPPTDPYRNKDKDARRAYYVWRLARFHGGKDVTTPMTASMFSTGDPFLVELDALSDAVAKRAFGTDLAAAYRWGIALGHIDWTKAPGGLPASAYSGGPVVDGNKPSWELIELIGSKE